MTLLDLSTKSIKSSEDVTALSSSAVNTLAGKLTAFCKIGLRGPSPRSSRVAFNSSSISFLMLSLSSSSRSLSLLLNRLFGVDVAGVSPSSSSESSNALGLEVCVPHSSVVCMPLLYENTSFTGDGGNSKTVAKGTVDSVCVEMVYVWGCGWLTDGSEFSLLSSPALSTLLGRLPFPAGEPAPAGPVEVGLLLPPTSNNDSRYLSNSARLSPRFGVGETS